MDKIILLILLNILVYYLYKKNIYLLIALFIFMIYYTLKMSKNIEGNSEYSFYKYNFAKSLNDNVKTDREGENLFGKLTKKLNMFLRRYIYYQELPKDQPCVGKFNKWSKCSRSCGRGNQYRTFNVLQKAGKGGIECIYENGDIDKKECYNKKCEYFEGCDDDLDCDTHFCDPDTKKCGIENECSKNALHNCDFTDCENLGKNYHYNIKKGCDYYKLKNIIE